MYIYFGNVFHLESEWKSKRCLVAYIFDIFVSKTCHRHVWFFVGVVLKPLSQADQGEMWVVRKCFSGVDYVEWHAISVF